MTTGTSARPLLRHPGTLLRTYAASLVANLPLLALMLIPQLMRSRAGSESLLAAGTIVLLALVIAAVVIAPEVGAAVAPRGEWRLGRARAAVRELFRSRRRAALGRLAEFAGLYLLSQVVGGLVAGHLPHVSDNPEFGVASGAGRWVVDYPNFAVQAVSMYLVVCVATAWYGVRMRQLALDSAASRAAGVPV
jgi:hypothetical protein